MSISRRGFLGILGGLAAAPIVEPIAKAFFLPPSGGWLPTASGIVVPGNQLITTEWITKEALRILQANLSFVASANRHYDQQFANQGAKIGNALNIRRPLRGVA